MARLVDWVAPRTWAGAGLRAALLVGLIAVVKDVALGLLGRPVTLSETLLMVASLLPIAAGIMAVLLHLRRLQRELTVLATTDVLTGLANRRAFIASAREATEGGRGGALLILDADHFKRINDALGHAAGDACLQAIAQHLRATLRPQDIVGRVGGEEFAVFLPGAARTEAEAVGERLCRAVAVEAAGVEERLRVTLSAGAALGERGLPLDRLMARADEALYEAKATGRARLVVWPGAAGRSRAA